jgi:hypothetical protein
MIIVSGLQVNISNRDVEYGRLSESCNGTIDCEALPAYLCARYLEERTFRFMLQEAVYSTFDTIVYRLQLS